MGVDLSAVRVHTGPEADQASRAADAEAVTQGSNIYFRAGRYQPAATLGRLILAHELVHVAQQKGSAATTEKTMTSPGDRSEREASRLAPELLAARPGAAVRPTSSVPAGTVSRYKSFEHAEAGEIGGYLTDAFPYVVKKGEMPAAIAKKFGVPLAELLERNKAKLRTWVTPTGHHIQGFNAGATIAIPSTGLRPRTPAKGEAPTAAPIGVTIAGVAMDYGTAVAMADYYETPETMIGAPATEMTALKDLIAAEGKAPASVTEAQWQAATAGRAPVSGVARTYMDLNMRNVEHFAPAAGATIELKAGIDNRDSWHLYHKVALETAHAGDLGKALAINAFADHFLTDAFAAGHMINKQDIMTRVGARLTTQAQREAMANAVATQAWTSARVQTVCRGFEGQSWGFWGQIDRDSRLGTVLAGIAEQLPGLLPNAIVGAIHDDLNASGVEVENSETPPLKWVVKGDGSMEAKGLDAMRRAVALSYLQVVNAKDFVGPIDYSTMEKSVWSIVPVPTKAGQTTITAEVAALINPTDPATIRRVADMVIANIDVLMDSAAARAPDRIRRRAP